MRIDRALALCLAVAAGCAYGQALDLELHPALPPFRAIPVVPPISALPTSPHHADWARAISAAATVSLVDQGTAAAAEALIDCQKGEYPGGGKGVLSLPAGRVDVITDHCHR